MDDWQFREDENELPYMLWEKRDGGRRNGRRKSLSPEMHYDDIPFREFPSYVRRLMIGQNDMDRIIDSIVVRPSDCRFSMHHKGNIVDFSFVLENKYWYSEFKASYELNISKMTFYLPINGYEGLRSMEWFESEVRRIESEIGLEFQGCDGGYLFKWADDKLEITDEVEVFAYFSGKGYDSDYHSYKVDFTNRRLEKYHVHNWFEFFEPCLD